MGQFIRLVVNSNIVSSDAPLGPIIGQYGLNAREVVKSINAETSKFFLNGIPVKVHVIFFKDKTFYIKLFGVCNSTLLEYIVGNSGFIYKSEVYNLALLNKKLHNLENSDVLGVYKSLLSTVVSMKVDVVNG